MTWRDNERVQLIENMQKLQSNIWSYLLTAYRGKELDTCKEQIRLLKRAYNALIRAKNDLQYGCKENEQ